MEVQVEVEVEDKLRPMGLVASASTSPEIPKPAETRGASWPAIWHLALLLGCIVSLCILAEFILAPVHTRDSTPAHNSPGAR